MQLDPISDMLTRIRNAQSVGKPEVEFPYSNVKLAVIKALKNCGFIGGFKEISFDGKKFIGVSLNYVNNKPKIKGIVRISKPGNRVYAKSKNLHRFLHGFGIYIISTSKGVMSDKEARKNKLGGEIICSVW